jgi:hypothetical protein
VNIEAIIRETLAGEWLPTVYADKIRSRRTRALHIEIPEKENAPEIIYTLLGVELKVGKRRFACPDLATARYMRVFARVGCGDFAIPYDITKVSVAADELETCWQRALIVLDSMMAGRSPRAIAVVRSRLIRSIRVGLTEIGPGEVMPKFDRETRQRMA